MKELSIILLFFLSSKINCQIEFALRGGFLAADKCRDPVEFTKITNCKSKRFTTDPVVNTDPDPSPSVSWNQKCQDNAPKHSSGYTCGDRNFNLMEKLGPGEASPGEFPWTCTMYAEDRKTKKQRLLGACVIVPPSTDNRFPEGVPPQTDVVLTTKAKLAGVKGPEKVVVKIVKYDPDNFNGFVERNRYYEHTVFLMLLHPDHMNRTRFNNIAALLLTEPIEMKPEEGISSACFPGCDGMFDFKFDNGTGVRCWVNTLAERSPTAHILHKIDVPIFPDKAECQRIFRTNPQGLAWQPGLKKIKIFDYEICAGGEGADTKKGDGGIPLMCESKNGKWNVVGLTSWGIVGAPQRGVPSIYTDVAAFKDWLQETIDKQRQSQATVAFPRPAGTRKPELVDPK